jgi:hypothetical protein
MECIACNNEATIKDYRTRYGVTDGYPVCRKHVAIDDRNFWKAVNNKEKKRGIKN